MKNTQIILCRLCVETYSKEITFNAFQLKRVIVVKKLFLINPSVMLYYIVFCY